ncbi:TRAP transporter substrate-binding protein [Oscillibacter sp.]|uniref:TRAP transporter substrate-binding protein n=1 Tax=Oscillibacter sp. TaxID=1945593 RepID=UPI00260BF769|nr:TRAP transporter substrate-binding protein [Oscillibacter sp.]MDD3347649.1 TRAP transporter substrate-binding protein [Oscillibacter sp.]
MKKRILSLILASVMLLPLVACGGSKTDGAAGTTGTSGAAPAKAIPLKVATYYADTHPTSIALEEVFKPMVEEATEGRYTVELYGNNALGGEAEFNEGVKMGTIEMCVTGNIMGDQYPALYAADFPWLFDDVKQASEVSNNPELTAMFQSAFDQCNMTCLGLSINGNRCVSNNVHPINTLADLKGIKLRLPEAAHYVANFKALGATTVTMGLSEVFTALQQGTINGQENPPTTLLTNGWYEVQPYLAITNHQISMNFVNVNTNFYKSMSEADQKALQEAVTAFVAKQLELYQAGMEADVETLKEKGVEVTYPDREEFKKAGSVVIDDYCAKYPDFKTAVDKVHELQGA